MSLVEQYHAEHKARIMRMGGYHPPVNEQPVKQPRKRPVPQKYNAGWTRMWFWDLCNPAPAQHAIRLPVGRRIMLAVVRHYNVSLTDIYSRRRTKDVVKPRQLIMYLARTYTTMSLMQIGNLLGGRDHTTVSHACRKIDQYRAEDPEIDLIIAKIKQDTGLA